MRKLVLVLLLLLPAVALAQEEINPNIGFGVENPEDLGITNPKAVSMLDLEFTIGGTFNIVPKRGTLNELSLELFSFPKEDYYSSVSDLSTDPVASLGDESLLYTWEDLPQGETDYEISTNIVNNFNIKKLSSRQPFPFSNIPEEYQIYLEASEKINSDDEEIKRTANEIILGETDAYVVAYKLAKYVSNEMTYDLAYLGRIESGKNVLRDKTGVCVEYANLFMSLARSVGIPTRYISGYAYGNVYGTKFNAHAWTEVYLPNIGWIPFDPTFGEFGWVDMTHLKTQISDVPTDPSLSYTWIGGDVSTEEPSTKVELNTLEETLPDLIKNQIWLEMDEIGFGSYNIVWMSLENTQNYYLASDTFLTSSPKIIGKNQKSTLLLPKESKTIGWIIKIPDDLDSDYTYTYTVAGENLFGSEKSIKFKVDPDSNNKITLEQAQKLLGLDKEDILPSTEVTSDLNINIRYPEVEYTNEEFNIIVEIYNSGTAPISNLEVCIENTGKDCDQVFLGINDRQNLVFPKKAITTGTKKYFVTFDGEGIEESQVVEVEIIERTLLQKISKFFKDLFGIN